MEINFPKKYKKLDIESKWVEQWGNQSLYDYDPNIGKENTFVVDTPPPTVSGDLHMGHVFSYTQTDIVVRYQRMNGKNIFTPSAGITMAYPPSVECKIYTKSAATPHCHTSPWNSPLKKIKKHACNLYPDKTSPKHVNNKPPKTRKNIEHCGNASACLSTGAMNTPPWTRAR